MEKHDAEEKGNRRETNGDGVAELGPVMQRHSPDQFGIVGAKLRAEQ